jgi:DNA modification methylase
VKPYYDDGSVVIYHGDCREILPRVEADVLVTDPPYPNNAGHFDDAVPVAESVLRAWGGDAIVFWTELVAPPLRCPLVAVHVWHRANVNGRPYEPAYHFAIDGIKRRSDVLRHAAIFDGVGPGCWEYLGHPTQKPVALMQALIEKVGGVTLDPFAGSGSTLRAAKNLGRKAIGIEIEERYCEIAAQRCAQEVLALEAA